MTIVAKFHSCHFLLGDGNIHLNISIPEYDPQVTAKIEPFVYEWVAKHKGKLGLGKCYEYTCKLL